MKNGDLWSFFAKSTQARGAQAVRLSKVKGHATQEMVEKGTVRETDKMGNDEADVGADEGAVGEQQELSTAARKYATRQWRYKVFMARVHQYIIHLRKAYREKMDAKENGQPIWRCKHKEAPNPDPARLCRSQRSKGDGELKHETHCRA